MKKWILALGILSVVAVAGCGSDSEEGTNGETNNETEQTSENQEMDEQAVKKELLNVQMDLTNTFKTFQQKINAYQEALSAEEVDEQAIQQTGEEAKKAASEGAAAAGDYAVEADLPEEMKTNIEETLPALQAYYEEVETALTDNMENADFTAAEEKFTEFNDQFGEILQDAGFPATPNLMKEMS
ncbi:hypothetical protein SAMN04487936_10660 [Halobacillus dabanensis]|uniref:Lipoprotein n=1 Tax=Halobacillus dabanensis TaxID=240302 RepID=A0A1I3VWL7_HALDA|nr:hypothetical protein [Halobacillus dabanensis]SFJ99343.1 hypothetical protein SAMN04487936_10660 [Halobacillus dabanensis]